MRPAIRNVLGVSLVLGLVAGCENSRPGAGFTNGEPAPAFSPEKAGARNDLPVPDAPVNKDQPLAEAADSGAAADVSTSVGTSGVPNTSTKAAGKKDSQATGGTKPADDTKAGKP